MTKKELVSLSCLVSPTTIASVPHNIRDLTNKQELVFNSMHARTNSRTDGRQMKKKSEFNVEPLQLLTQQFALLTDPNPIYTRPLRTNYCHIISFFFVFFNPLFSPEKRHS